MKKVCRYTFYDLIRSKWLVSYTLFFLVVSTGFFWLTPDFTKVIVSMMNMVLILVPLVAMMFSVMYFYNAREFTELLLAQPLRRRDIFLGQYIAVAGSLSSAILIGIGIPFFLFGIHRSDMLAHFLILTGLGIILSFIFTALAFLIAQRNENRMKGFGIAIFAWLFLAVLYDGLFILLLSWLSEYPLENAAIAGVFLNPIDLARILILLKLDISALMGYTGAVFQRFIGTQYGIVIAAGLLFCWIGLPLWKFLAVSAKKDY